VLTTALVVAGGVGGFIGSFSAHTSLVDMRDAYYESGRFAHVFVMAKRVPQHVGSRMRHIPGVLAVETTVVGNVLVTLPGATEALTGRIIALPARGEPQMNRVRLKSGRWVLAGDAEGVLVSDAFAKARSLAPGDSVSLLMNGKYESFTVRGIAGSPEFIFTAAPGFKDDTRYGVFWSARERIRRQTTCGARSTATVRHARHLHEIIDAADRPSHTAARAPLAGRTNRPTARSPGDQRAGVRDRVSQVKWVAVFC
jgi:putative ABC transport system permease protein